MISTGPKPHLEKDHLIEGSLFLESSKFIVLISLFSVLLHYFYLRKPPMGWDHHDFHFKIVDVVSILSEFDKFIGPTLSVD